MSNRLISRRDFCRGSAASAGLLFGACQSLPNPSNTAPQVLIIGGGFGGATAAKYIRKLDPRIKVTLIESARHYVTCPGSNWVFAGLKTVPQLRFNYAALCKKYAINFIHGTATAIDPIKHQLVLANGTRLRYDRLIVACGIDFRWEQIEGYDQKTAQRIPHAWQAGQQTTTLNRQLQAMPDGGTVVICAPPNPFKCPPGPYERASMMAHYLKRHKPKSKILIIDPKAQFAKQSLFIAGWREHYGYGSDNSMIEWVSLPDNPIVRVDAKTNTVKTYFGNHYRGDVLNIIPPQKAGSIAEQTGLTDASGWCPVDHRSCESTLLPDIHVIGDAAIQHPLPKSAFAANSEAKICAFAIVNQFNNQALIEPVWINTCYSLITPTHGISVAMVYKMNAAGLLAKVKGAGGITNPEPETLRLESQFARHWYASITADSFY